jgi:hypothetical protein
VTSRDSILRGQERTAAPCWRRSTLCHKPVRSARFVIVGGLISYGADIVDACRPPFKYLAGLRSSYLRF